MNKILIIEDEEAIADLEKEGFAIFLDEKITLMGGIGAALTILGLFVSSKKPVKKS